MRFKKALLCGLIAAQFWTPSQLASLGLATWWDPSDLSTMWQDSAGTTPAEVDQPVGRMVDKLRGLVVTATGGARPYLRASGQWFWLEFDGLDDVLTGVAAGYGLIAPSHYLALVGSKANQAGAPFFSCNVDATNYHRLNNVSTLHRASGTARDAAGSRTALSGASTMLVGQVKVVDSLSAAAGLDVTVNGAGLVGAVAAQPAGNAQIIIGNVSNAMNIYGAVSLLGDPSPMRGKVLAFLAAKGGTSL